MKRRPLSESGMVRLETTHPNPRLNGETILKRPAYGEDVLLEQPNSGVF
jgi:hypothetical protein